MPTLNKFLLVFGLLIGSVSYGQNFDAGVDLGIVASQVHADNHGGYNKSGVSGSIFVSTKLKGDKRLGFALRYIQKGSRMSPEQRERTFEDYKIALSYVEVPIYLSFPVWNQFDLQAGISFGLLVSQYEGDHNGVYPVFRDFNKFDANANLQLNYNFAQQYKLIMSWAYSIVPIREHPSGTTAFLNYGMLNNAIAIGLAYEFNR